MKFRGLKAEEIDVRIGNIISQGYTLLLYKDARCDMNILDETVGSGNWQRDHKEIKGNLFCGVAIWDEEKSQWIWKWDCGTESNTEKEKGEASDSFKRACFNLGIGRELYTSPFIKIDCNIENGKLPDNEKYRKFRVKEIEYFEDENKREITKLVIVDNKNVQVFPKVKQQPDSFGGNYMLSSGKYKGKTIKEADEDDEEYLQSLLNWDKLSDILRKNITAYLNLKNNGNEDVTI